MGNIFSLLGLVLALFSTLTTVTGSRMRHIYHNQGQNTYDDGQNTNELKGRNVKKGLAGEEYYEMENELTDFWDGQTMSFNEEADVFIIFTSLVLIVAQCTIISS